MNTLLLKGLEEEVYTVTPQGEPVGLAHIITSELNGFDCEPDARNVEYTTIPHRDYRQLAAELMCRRHTLRNWLQARDGLTLMPGGALSLGNTREFIRSKPGHPYHDWIENQYGARVVTASNHLNVGIEDTEELIRAWRVIRCEASLFLALTAASPFIDGKLTGFHSWRWHDFPKTPENVPFFRDYAHYHQYVTEQMKRKVMNNIRHLWLSVRPNGNGAPNSLDRLELRVCDRMHELDLLMAVTAAFEIRVQQVLADPDLDPLQGSLEPDELIALCDANEAAAARSSLDADLRRWDTGDTGPARAWLDSWIGSLEETAEALGIRNLLPPLRRVLTEGNTAMHWLRQAETKSVPEIIRAAIEEDTEAFQAYASNRDWSGCR